MDMLFGSSWDAKTPQDKAVSFYTLLVSTHLTAASILHGHQNPAPQTSNVSE